MTNPDRTLGLQKRRFKNTNKSTKVESEGWIQIQLWEITWVQKLALHPEPQTLHPEPQSLHPEPQTLHREPQTLHPEPQTLNPEPQTLHPTPVTLNPTLDSQTLIPDPCITVL